MITFVGNADYGHEYPDHEHTFFVWGMLLSDSLDLCVWVHQQIIRNNDDADAAAMKIQYLGSLLLRLCIAYCVFEKEIRSLCCIVCLCI